MTTPSTTPAPALRVVADDERCPEQHRLDDIDWHCVRKAGDPTCAAGQHWMMTDVAPW